MCGYDINESAPDRDSEAVEGSGVYDAVHARVTQLRNSAGLLIVIRPGGIWSP